MIEIITKEMINKMPDRCYIEGCVFIVDYTLIKKDVCPSCKEKSIRDFGLGTEK